MKAIEKYEYFKKDNSKKIILVKEGSFYKTYLDDAKLMWQLFHYKWNNNTIAFGISNSSKVFDKLNSNGIGYATVENDSEIIKVDGDDRVYELYLQLAIINYDKQTKRKELHNILDKLIDNDPKNYNQIKNYFEKLLKGDKSNEQTNDREI